MRIRISLPVLLALLSISLMAQVRRPGGGNRPGTRNTPNVFGSSAGRQVRVDIQITNDSSEPLYDSQAMVQLSAQGGGPQETFVGSNGHATFTVSAGSYVATVSGAGIETASTTFEVGPGEMFHHEEIAVRLKREGGTRAPGGMVSAENLKIPSKARKEFSAGIKEMQANRLENAKKHFEKAIKEYPNYDWAYNNLGVVEIQLKHPEAAKQAFLKAIALNDKNADAMGNLGQMKYADNDLDGAKELLERSLAVQPNNSKNLLVLALAQAKTGDYAAALTNAEKVHQGDIDHYPIAHYLAAEVRERMGDHAGAERQYQAYLKEAPDGPQASQAKKGLERVEARK